MQSAYRAAHSTETALVMAVEDILQTVNSDSIVTLVVLDISVAFDTVNHSTLLHGEAAVRVRCHGQLD